MTVIQIEQRRTKNLVIDELMALNRLVTRASIKSSWIDGARENSFVYS